MSNLGEAYKTQAAQLALASRAVSDPLGILAACCALGEAFASSVLEERIEATNLEDHPLARFMLRELERDRTSTWKERGKWLRATGLCGLTGSSWYQDFVLLTETRNAMLHGNGQLTSRQAGQVSGLVDLRRKIKHRLGVPIFGTTIHLSRAQPSMWVALTAEFISKLDRVHDLTAPSTHLAAPRPESRQ